MCSPKRKALGSAEGSKEVWLGRVDSNHDCTGQSRANCQLFDIPTETGTASRTRLGDGVLFIQASPSKFVPELPDLRLRNWLDEKDSNLHFTGQSRAYYRLHYRPTEILWSSPTESNRDLMCFKQGCDHYTKRGWRRMIELNNQPVKVGSVFEADWRPSPPSSDIFPRILSLYCFSIFRQSRRSPFQFVRFLANCSTG